MTDGKKPTLEESLRLLISGLKTKSKSEKKEGQELRKVLSAIRKQSENMLELIKLTEEEEKKGEDGQIVRFAAYKTSKKNLRYQKEFEASKNPIQQNFFDLYAKLFEGNKELFNVINKPNGISVLVKETIESCKTKNGIGKRTGYIGLSSEQCMPIVEEAYRRFQESTQPNKESSIEDIKKINLNSFLGLRNNTLRANFELFLKFFIIKELAGDKIPVPMEYINTTGIRNGWVALAREAKVLNEPQGKGKNGELRYTPNLLTPEQYKALGFEEFICYPESIKLQTKEKALEETVVLKLKEEGLITEAEKKFLTDKAFVTLVSIDGEKLRFSSRHANKRIEEKKEEGEQNTKKIKRSIFSRDVQRRLTGGLLGKPQQQKTNPSKKPASNDDGTAIERHSKYLLNHICSNCSIVIIPQDTQTFKELKTILGEKNFSKDGISASNAIRQLLNNIEKFSPEDRQKRINLAKKISIQTAEFMKKAQQPTTAGKNELLRDSFLKLRKNIFNKDWLVDGTRGIMSFLDNINRIRNECDFNISDLGLSKEYADNIGGLGVSVDDDSKVSDVINGLIQKYEVDKNEQALGLAEKLSEIAMKALHHGYNELNGEFAERHTGRGSDGKKSIPALREDSVSAPAHGESVPDRSDREESVPSTTKITKEQARTQDRLEDRKSYSSVGNGTRKHREYGDSTVEYGENVNGRRRIIYVQPYSTHGQYSTYPQNPVNGQNTSVGYGQGFGNGQGITYGSATYPQNPVNGQNTSVGYGQGFGNGRGITYGSATYPQNPVGGRNAYVNGQLANGQLNVGNQLDLNLLLYYLTFQIVMSSYMLQSLFLPRQENYQNMGAMIRGLSALNVPNPPSFIGGQGNFVGSCRFDMYPFYNALSMCLFHRNDGYKFSDLPEFIERSYGANVGFRDLISNLNNNDCEILLGNIYDSIRYNYGTMTTQDMSVIQDIITSISATRTIDLRNRERDAEYLSNRLSTLSQSLNLINASKDIGIRARIRRESFTFNI